MAILSPMLFGFLVLVILIGLFVLIFSPEVFVPELKINATEICISKCQEELARGRDLSDGPCLLDPIPEERSWVCDVAHWPREAVDNLPENQCSAFLEGKSPNFVEVTPECEFIRATPKPSHIFIRIKEGAYYYLGRLGDAIKKLFDMILSLIRLK